jgi:hypothetical protein
MCIAIASLVESSASGWSWTALTKFGLGVFPTTCSLVFNSLFLRQPLHMMLTTVTLPLQVTIYNRQHCCRGLDLRPLHTSGETFLANRQIIERSGTPLRPASATRCSWKAMTRMACKHINQAQSAWNEPGLTCSKKCVCALRPELSAPPPF